MKSIILLSPSKTLDENSPFPTLTPTQPRLLSESEKLIAIMRKKSPKQIGKLMDISDKLAALNHQRFQDFSLPFTAQNARPCIFTFKGDVYDGLHIEQFNAKALQNAQTHLRILSGLYGLLRPLDLMQPYRLEMGTALKNTRGKNLYEFWGDRLTDLLNEDAEEIGAQSIINLASQEYFSAINPKRLRCPVITPVFKEIKGNQAKVIGLFAKRARGMMARHLLTSSGGIDRFQEANYRLDSTLSSEKERIFTRAA